MIGLVGYASDLSKAPKQSLEIKQLQMENYLISIILPPIADIKLKDGNSRSGQLISLNSKEQKCELDVSGFVSTVVISDIQKIVFRGEVDLSGTTKIVIRGEDETVDAEETWNESLKNCEIIEPLEGEAQISLTSVSKPKLKAIRAVAEDNRYVVKEIEFESSEKMLIKVAPYSY